MSSASEDMPDPLEAERALAAARASGDPRTVGGAESYVGAAYLAHGRGAEALEPLRAAERTFAAAGLHREAAIARVNVARCLSETGRGDEAVAEFTAAGAGAELERDVAAEVWRGLVDHFSRVGDPGRATALLAEAASRSEGAALADLLVFQGSVHHQLLELHRAADCFSRAAAAYDAAGDDRGAAAARHNLEVVTGG